MRCGVVGCPTGCDAGCRSSFLLRLLFKSACPNGFPCRQVLELRDHVSVNGSCQPPRSAAARGFVRLLGESDTAFEEVFVIGTSFLGGKVHQHSWLPDCIAAADDHRAARAVAVWLTDRGFPSPASAATQLLDVVWLDKKATYMEFPLVLK